jgi:hypothetical protein
LRSAIGFSNHSQLASCKDSAADMQPYAFQLATFIKGCEEQAELKHPQVSGECVLINASNKCPKAKGRFCELDKNLNADTHRILPFIGNCLRHGIEASDYERNSPTDRPPSQIKMCIS